MKLSNAQMQEIDTILKEYCNTKEALSMKNFCQHGSVSTYEHVMYVTRVCYYLNERFKLGADVKALVVGAFLHDFYLYDWHDKDDSHKWHGFSHANTALVNANAHFALNDKERDIIAHHMWPLNLTKLPRCREALLVCLVDKYCSTVETLTMRSAESAF